MNISVDLISEHTGMYSDIYDKQGHVSDDDFIIGSQVNPNTHFPHNYFFFVSLSHIYFDLLPPLVAVVFSSDQLKIESGRLWYW